MVGTFKIAEGARKSRAETGLVGRCETFTRPIPLSIFFSNSTKEWAFNFVVFRGLSAMTFFNVVPRVLISMPFDFNVLTNTVSYGLCK